MACGEKKLALFFFRFSWLGWAWEGGRREGKGTGKRSRGGIHMFGVFCKIYMPL